MSKQSARIWAVSGIISQLRDRDIINASTQALNTISLQADWILERCRAELKRRYYSEQIQKTDAESIAKIDQICTERFEAIKSALEDDEPGEQEEFPFEPDTSMR